MIGRTDLAEDPRFATLQARADNHKAVDDIVREWIKYYCKHEAMRIWRAPTRWSTQTASA